MKDSLDAWIAKRMRWRERCKIAGFWLALAANFIIWVTRVLDYSSTPTALISAKQHTLDFEHGSWQMVSGFLKGYRDGMVVCALIMTLALGLIGAGFLYGGLKEARWSFAGWQCVSGVAFLFMGIYFLGYLFFDGIFIYTFAIDTSLQGGISIITKSCSVLMGCTGKEIRVFQEKARQFSAHLSVITDPGDIKPIEKEIKSLKEQAEAIGYSLPELVLVKEQLAAVKTAELIRCTMKRDKVVSVQLLRSLSGLPAEKFAQLLIELCGKHDLSISGENVMLHDGVDIDTFVRDIDGYFARWRTNEGTKSDKLVAAMV